MLNWAGHHELMRHDALVSARRRNSGGMFRPPFPDPVGLAAGMDEDASGLPAWADPVSPKGAATSAASPATRNLASFAPSPMKPSSIAWASTIPALKPSPGTLADWRALGRWPGHPIGMNLGKSKITPLEKAARIMPSLFSALRPRASTFSSSTSVLPEHAEFCASSRTKPPSTMPKPDAKKFPDREMANPKSEIGIPNKPILVKVAPHLSFEALDEILELAGPRAPGIVATNTTVSRPRTGAPAMRRIYAEASRLRGRPLQARSTEIVQHLFRQTAAHYPSSVSAEFLTPPNMGKNYRGRFADPDLYRVTYEGPCIAREIVSRIDRAPGGRRDDSPSTSGGSCGETDRLKLII